MKLSISKEEVFIPSFNRNRELAETDQIRVRYKTPTMAIKNRVRKRPQAKAVASSGGGVDRMEIMIEKDEISTLVEMLVSISNCSYESDGREIKIISAQNLIDAPLDFEPLYKEIVKEFDRVLDESRLDEKN